jgi:hypothetical protein
MFSCNKLRPSVHPHSLAQYISLLSRDLKLLPKLLASAHCHHLALTKRLSPPCSPNNTNPSICLIQHLNHFVHTTLLAPAPISALFLSLLRTLPSRCHRLLAELNHLTNSNKLCRQGIAAFQERIASVRRSWLQLHDIALRIRGLARVVNTATTSSQPAASASSVLSASFSDFLTAEVSLTKLVVPVAAIVCGDSTAAHVADLSSLAIGTSVHVVGELQAVAVVLFKNKLMLVAAKSLRRHYIEDEVTSKHSYEDKFDCCEVFTY